MAVTNPTPTDVSAIRNYLVELQDRICTALETADRARIFREDRWQRPDGGEGSTRVLANGRIFERAGVAVSHVRGPALPPSATRRHPHLADRAFEAMGLSLVIHPESPYVPTTHLNLRFFRAAPAGGDAGAWWFGGGYDLTPYIVSPVDFAHWHRTAKAACDPFGTDLYPRFKQACDEYFFLPHRGEARGIGGLFFDDFNEGGFDASFALARSVGESFLPAYLPIVARRGTLGYSERERSHQLYRRGRYAEFNLVYDRGTQFGLQSGGRTESILMSMPPLAAWTYNWKPEAGSAEAELLDILQHPRNWV